MSLIQSLYLRRGFSEHLVSKAHHVEAWASATWSIAVCKEGMGSLWELCQVEGTGLSNFSNPYACLPECSDIVDFEADI